MTTTQDRSAKPAPVKPARVKPQLRGSSHYAAFFVALGAGAMLVATAGSTTAMIGALVYALSLCTLLGASALYHRPNWSPEKRAFLRRIDHAAIYVLIAGTFTPICLLALDPELSRTMLLIAWGGAGGGVVMEFVWKSAPKVGAVVIFLALGWVGVAAIPQISQHTGILGMSLLIAGGVLYSVGAIVYALRRPDPIPTVFGYHEIFHICVILASICHFILIAQFTMPG